MSQQQDFDSLDPTKNAVDILNHIFDETSAETVAVVAKEKIDLSPIRAELKKAPLVTVVSNREKSRVLFITKDVTALEENSMLRLHFKSLVTAFDEVHVLILTESWQSKRGVERVDKNMWMYTTSVRFWWLHPFAALRIAHSQLQFADGFRPDIVVALDPFESGLCGVLIASKYKRAFQVHVLEDYLVPEFKLKEEQNGWRVRIAGYVLKRALSVRFATKTLKQKVDAKYAHIKDSALLPRHYDIKAIMEATHESSLTRLYPQYTFLVLFVGKLDHDSTLFRAIDACRGILRSQSIGLMVLGDGPTKKESVKRAEILGIQQQVIFQSDETKMLEYMQSADILLCTDVTEASDEVVIKAAAAGLPLLMSETLLRNDLFVDGESAFLVQKDDTVGFSQKLTKFLNSNALRTQFKTNALDVVKTRLHEDPEAYKQAYRDSIEGIFAQDEPVKQ